MRAAEAAKNTAGLIEGTVKRVKNGSDVVERTNADFAQVESSTAKIGELVSEIAAASLEQAQGIDQISRAISEMDKVVQQNSANAEESASASEEMNSQAEQMKGFVGELICLVEGSSNGSTIETGSFEDSENKIFKQTLAIARNKAVGHTRRSDRKALPYTRK
jgi:methyl-accepting chemotaxis protein